MDETSDSPLPVPGWGEAHEEYHTRQAMFGRAGFPYILEEADIPSLNELLDALHNLCKQPNKNQKLKMYGDLCDLPNVLAASDTIWFKKVGHDMGQFHKWSNEGPVLECAAVIVNSVARRAS